MSFNERAAAIRSYMFHLELAEPTLEDNRIGPVNEGPSVGEFRSHALCARTWDPMVNLSKIDTVEHYARLFDDISNSYQTDQEIFRLCFTLLRTNMPPEDRSTRGRLPI